ncbi:hypothetical protein QN219_31930 [Sinorhizobium sp. 7-81]|uniref:hypothetical protein n=1 Tax=unclassified Sinorhizobium TaxID=2613772 RepID=UPI0024C3EF0B|nr:MULTISPECIES: hypothetical protein [unclassified Sinorhizobium]MDK1389943.1 hypothetical protein [Sinorhizobium sp. 7-81]MDK1494537.1 hypothetical protein [Sinorhizobium sp. 8-89]
MPALTLFGGPRDIATQSLLLREWFGSLDDIERATTATSIDGLLILAEGMNLFRDNVAGRKNDHRFSVTLRNLLVVNRQYLQSDRCGADRQSSAEGPR